MAWIIGDVHGCIKTLEALLKKIPSNEKIIFTGDLIDRGPNSKAVVELVRSNKYDCVKGNHEYMMSSEAPKILENNSLANSMWIENMGGYETLKSYKLINFFKFLRPPLNTITDDILWMHKLPLYLEYPDIKNDKGRHLLVTHSSINDQYRYKDSHKNCINYKSFQDTVLWGRTKFPPDNPNIYNIYGHTPLEELDIQGHCINIDTGACYNDGDLLGVLTAIEFPSMRVIQQKNID